MKILDLNVVTQPNIFFSEIVGLYTAQLSENKLVATISNEYCTAKGELLYFDSQNIAVLIDAFYHIKTQYNIPYRFEEKWGQILIVRMNDNSYMVSFEIRQSVESMLNDRDMSYQKIDNRIWIQEEGTQLKMLAIFISSDNLKNDWGLDIYMNYKQDAKKNILFKGVTNFIIDSLSENGRLLDTIFQKTHESANTIEKKHLVSNLGDNILNHLLFPNDERKKNNEGLKAAEELLLKDFRNQSDLTVLSKIAGMNRIKFQREFKEFYGESFYQYFQRHRFAHAKKLIEFMGYSSSEAAYAIGYKHLGHFSEEFIKVFGIKPSELKKGM